MLGTVDDLYKAFLDGIKMESTSVVTPSKFNRIANEAQLIWKRDNVKTVELSQKQIDDLRVLRMPPEVLSPTGIGSNIFGLPEEYFRLLNVEFSIDIGDIARSVMSEYKKANIKRSDQKTANKDNVYRKPSEDRLYYDLIQNNIYFDGGEEIALKAKIEYLRKPVDIDYDGGINCELPEEQRQEVVDIAIRIHLERIKSQRYQSFINEEAIKSQTK